MSYADESVIVWFIETANKKASFRSESNQSRLSNTKGIVGVLATLDLCKSYMRSNGDNVTKASYPKVVTFENDILSLSSDDRKEPIPSCKSSLGVASALRKYAYSIMYCK